MKRPTIRILIKAKAAALKASAPRSRDRLRRELRALEVVQQMRRERRAA